MLRTLIAIVVALIGAAATTGALHAQGESTPGATPVVEPVDPEAAAAYCVEQGGEVRERVPMLNTNLPREAWVELGTPQRFCEFAQDEGDDADSWISISLETLYTPSPTLAALAYLTTLPCRRSPVGRTHRPPTASTHTGDVIRGTDLTPILRYQPENPPQVFPGQ